MAFARQKSTTTEEVLQKAYKSIMNYPLLKLIEAPYIEDDKIVSGVSFADFGSKKCNA